jgi:hypothetical protein
MENVLNLPRIHIFFMLLGGTDRADQVMAHRSTRAKTQRWPMLVGNKILVFFLHKPAPTPVLRILDVIPDPEVKKSPDPGSATPPYTNIFCGFLLQCCFTQCSGSMTFWGGFGSGSAALRH